jgi:hypothetical protein
MEDVMIENLDRRLARVEQILPTLATKEDLTRAIAPLATKEELQATAASLRHEISNEGERSRRYMDVLIEAVRGDVQLIAEHLASRPSKRAED